MFKTILGEVCVGRRELFLKVDCCCEGGDYYIDLFKNYDYLNDYICYLGDVIDGLFEKIDCYKKYFELD